MVDNTASTVPMLAPCGCPTEACRPFLLSVSIGGDLVRKSTALCLACGNTFTYETLPMPLPTVSESKPLVSALPSGTLVKYRQLGAAFRTRGENEAADAIIELAELLRAVDAALVSEHEAGCRMAKVVRQKNQALAAAEVEKTRLALEIVEAATALLRWIPVEEGLPTSGGHVLVFRHVMPGDPDTANIPPTGLHYVECAHYGADGFTVDGEDDYGPANVSHWMPLPAPPEKEPVVGRAEPAPPVEGNISFAIERIVPADDVDAVTGRRRHMLASHLAEMMSLLAGSFEESKIGSRDYRIRISVEPER